MALQFVVLAAGLHALVVRSAPPGAPRERLQSDFFVAFLFLAANYVYALWFARGSLAEVWVYCLMPWVVAAPCRRAIGPLARGLPVPADLRPSDRAGAEPARRGDRGLQPDRADAVGLIRRGLVPAVARGRAVATPFWLPQALWQDVILGPKALPAALRRLLPAARRAGQLPARAHGRHLAAAGRMLLVIVAARARLPLQLLGAGDRGAVVITALQTNPSVRRSRATSRRSTCRSSCGGWRCRRRSCCSARCWSVGATGAGRRAAAAGACRLAHAGHDVRDAADRPGVRRSTRLRLAGGPAGDVGDPNVDGVWGVREYLPNYKKLPGELRRPPERARATLPRGPRRRTRPRRRACWCRAGRSGWSTTRPTARR